MTLQKDMIVEADEFRIRITDPNPTAPKAVILDGKIPGELSGMTDLEFEPLDASGRTWITTGGFILHDWMGDGSCVSLNRWNE